MPTDNLLFGFASKLTEEQKVYVDSIFDYQLTIVNALSGSGKTTLAVACSKLLGKDLVYIFSPLEEKKLGYRPGTQEEKESAYLSALYDAVIEINEVPEQVIYREDLLNDGKNKQRMAKAIKEGQVWIYPRSHIFVRGMNIKDKTVIIDEAQNFNKSELKKVLTRIHDSCTVIMIGHSGQIDMEDCSKSGLEEYIEHFRNEEYANICELSYNFRGRLAHHADQI